ncbi:MAG: mechanosensitive ion channel [Bacteroidales bacterium]|jgi:miniconductance mechanosensitive channel|nr:mechanosensitive ion channel [Bacteroidales bacterium]NPV37469.1 mechanosensitive ion channel [Bacteroidales bacterium]
MLSIVEYLRDLSRLVKHWLIGTGLSNFLATTITDYMWLIGLFLLAILVFYITKNIVYRIIRRVARKSKTPFDDFLIERKFFVRLCYLVPAYLVQLMIPMVISQMHGLIVFLQTLTSIYITFIILLAIDAFLNASHDLYLTLPVSKDKPIKGFIQVVKIIAYSVGVIIIIALLSGKKPLALLGGLGAISAILLLVFKDSILGFVAGMQLTANNMIRIGDWISMPKHDADGTVREITLTTVKVENFDKTYTFIPAYSLVSDSFRNWRGMEEAGVRRITRAINIDVNSVKFCTPEMLQKFEQVAVLQDYIRYTEEEIRAYNQQFGYDNTVLVNGRRQTNLGVFRAYLSHYLKNNPFISNDHTLIVRHLAPTEKGLPVQIYCFANTTEWAQYEKIQADIFDHVFAVIPFFELRLFQNPTGADFRGLVN